MLHYFSKELDLPFPAQDNIPNADDLVLVASSSFCNFEASFPAKDIAKCTLHLRRWSHPMKQAHLKEVLSFQAFEHTEVKAGGVPQYGLVVMQACVR